jgi:RHS repeat-associated protein
MVQSVTSLDNATPGSGTALNQTWSTYNTFGQSVEEQQEHSGTVTTGSVSVGYAYDSGASSSNEIRLNGLTYPNGRLIDYSFAAGMDSTLNRITAIVDDATRVTLASYAYLGLSTVVRITYPEPGIWLDLWGGTSGTFNGLDQFNRIIDQRWQSAITTTPTDIDRYQYGYDQNSNRLWKANVVGTAAVGNLDEGYTYDTLNRLTDMKRGTLSGGVITGTPTVQQNWSLDATGNWSTFATAAGGTTNLNQQRTANTVNEITAITETTGPNWITPTYNPAGNTTTMPQVADPTQSFTAVYDAWSRTISISNTTGPVGTYGYDGRNRRIVKVISGEIRHFYWTNMWQDVEERVGTSATMDKQFVWGIRYIDELVCRDAATPQRLYSCQDANLNLTAITNASGTVQERNLFDPYGNRTVMNASWTIITSSAYAWNVAYQGLMHEDESGLFYARGRYQDSNLGRWTQRDPEMYANSPNDYQSELSNPLRDRDPRGTSCTLDCPAVRDIQTHVMTANNTASQKMAKAWRDLALKPAGQVIGLIAKILELGAAGINYNNVQLDYLALVYPCTCPQPGAAPQVTFPAKVLTWEANPVGPAQTAGGFVAPPASSPTDWQRSKEAADRGFAQVYNQWVTAEFPNCPNINPYLL